MLRRHHGLFLHINDLFVRIVLNQKLTVLSPVRIQTYSKTAAAAVVVILSSERHIIAHICSPRALNQLRVNAANVRGHFPSKHWETIQSRPNTFAHTSMKRGCAALAVRLFSPEHPHSSVSFFSKSLTAAGTKDTSVQGL